MMKRDEAFELLKDYVKSDSLIKHALAVEAGMRGYAKKYNEDVEYWGVVGLLHDIDYEQHPEEHPSIGVEILKEKGLSEDVLTAVKEHAELDKSKTSLMSKVLFGVDELSSFIVACVLVRPDKDFTELKLKSVKKKFKSSAFARGVDRDIVQRSADELQIDLSEHMQNVIDALTEREKELNEIGFSLVN